MPNSRLAYKVKKNEVYYKSKSKYGSNFTNIVFHIDFSVSFHFVDEICSWPKGYFLYVYCNLEITVSLVHHSYSNENDGWWRGLQPSVRGVHFLFLLFIWSRRIIDFINTREKDNQYKGRKYNNYDNSPFIYCCGFGLVGLRLTVVKPIFHSPHT